MLAMQIPELLDGWFPQQAPAQEMPIIVPHFWPGMVIIIFGGRNSGQFQTCADLELRDGLDSCEDWSQDLCLELGPCISELFSSRGLHPRKPRECSFGRQIGFGRQRTQ